jgi:hypothetical protein
MLRVKSQLQIQGVPGKNVDPSGKAVVMRNTRCPCGLLIIQERRSVLPCAPARLRMRNAAEYRLLAAGHNRKTCRCHAQCEKDFHLRHSFGE